MVEKPNAEIAHAIIKQNTRILTPHDAKMLREELNPSYKAIMDGLIESQVRVEEFWEILEHPSWFRPSRRCIDLPRGSIKKIRCLNKERSVILTEKGCATFEKILKMDLSKISRSAMGEALKLAAIKAKLPIGTLVNKNGIVTYEGADAGVSPKMFRKTAISWLVRSVPDKHLYVAASAGHSLEIMRKHYLGIAFSKEDIEDMLLFFKGWGE